MSPEQAEAILSDSNIQNCAIVLAAMDRLHSKDFETMEPELRKLGKFSESSVLTATDKVLRGYTHMAVPGNGNGIKMVLSIFLRGLQLLHRHKQVQMALQAVETLETIATE